MSNLKNEKAQLQDKKKAITVDLHTHLNEYNEKPKKYWDRVLELGLDGIAISEHADENPGEAYEKLASYKKENGITVPLIAGVEINTNIGHVLAYSSSPEMYDIKEFYEDGVNIYKVIKLAKKNDLLLSLSHPFGFGKDSAAIIMGRDRVRKLLKKYDIGVEAYNGLIGHVSYFMYRSKITKNPLKFLTFLERNIISRKIGLGSKISGLSSKLNAKSEAIIYKTYLAMDLAEKAKFMTAGSDSHSAERIGQGVLKLKFDYDEVNEKNILDAIRNKENVLWYGPLLEEIEDNVYEQHMEGFTKKELYQGLAYVARSKIRLVSNPLLRAKEFLEKRRRRKKNTQKKYDWGKEK